jgi:hypothetical protein
MDSHDRDHRLLARFLAGTLGPGQARRWDEHLLECEQCWRAVREDRAGRQAGQLLRQPVPPGLADRVAFSVEVAAGTVPARPPRRGMRLGRVLPAAAAALAAGLAATVVVVLLPGGHAGMPAPVAAVAHYAQTVLQRPPQPQPGQRAASVEVGHPVTMTAGGQRIVIRTWRLGGTEAVVATSGRPFPMPGSQGASAGGMAWSARAGKLSLYCINGRTSELVAAPVPVAELAALAAGLPLA